MRSLWIRGLAVFVSLALASWTAHAMNHDPMGSADHCQGTVGHAGTHGDHDHPGPADAPCCCDFVACALAALVTPAVAVGSADFSGVTYHLANTGSLSIDAPRLDPDPPRPSALS
jgi:hypothetical protein